MRKGNPRSGRDLSGLLFVYAIGFDVPLLWSWIVAFVRWHVMSVFLLSCHVRLTFEMCALHVGLAS